MSNVQSYNALIDRFKAFASGHFILKTFSHGQIDTADLEKFTEYPFMHVVPSNVTYAKGMKTFSFQIVLADLPRDKDDKVEFQREVLSDLQRIAEDLIAEITNHRVLFGDLITVQNVSLEPFLEEFHNTLTGWTISLDLLVPYYWDACSIPAEWNDFFESSTGGTGSILTFIDSIVRDENGNVSLVNDEATPSPNYYYGTDDEGVRGWYLLDAGGITCETIGDCQTIIDIESAIDDLQTEILLKADITSISAVGFSNDYNDLDNLPTIPTLTSDLTNDGADGVNPFITAQDLPSLTGYVPYTGATADVDLGTHNLTADHLALNVSPSGAGFVVGATQWNNTIGSSETLLKGGTVSLKNGVDLVARVVNKVTPNTTLTKAAYQAVRVSGAQGQRLAVAFAQANNDANSADTIGLVCETIATNQEGFIQTVGQLESINTTGSLQGETWTDGDVLYLSPTIAGALTNIKPTGATGHIVVIGYVEYAHANNGKIYVKIMNGWELDELQLI
jgi:nitrogen fixation protein